MFPQALAPTITYIAVYNLCTTAVTLGQLPEECLRDKANLQVVLQSLLSMLLFLAYYLSLSSVISVF